MPELVRAAALTAFPETARSFGLNPEALLAEVGIDRGALNDPEMRISAPAVAHLLELAAQRSKVEAFGLHVAETRNIAILGPIGLLLREEPTVRHAVESLAKYLFVHNETLVLRLDEIEDQAVLSVERHMLRHRPFRQGIELSIAVLYRLLQSLIGPGWQPIVCFAHEPPARRDVHHRVLGPRVDFRCNYNGLIFPTPDLARAVAGANPVFAEHARRYLESIAGRNGATLDISGQLDNTGGTFNEILDSVRAERAVRLLQNRKANLASTADMLGFSSDSAFSRWFLDQFGSRPSEWRRQIGNLH